MKSTLQKAKPRTEPNENIAVATPPVETLEHPARGEAPLTCTKTTPEIPSPSEIEGRNEIGQFLKSACPTWVEYRQDVLRGIDSRPVVRRAISIPGLDADKCKCDECSERNPFGVYWVDTLVRRQAMSKGKG